MSSPVMPVVMSTPTVVTAEEHPCEQEQEQGGDAETIAPLADDDAHKDEHCAKEENVFWCECHVVNVSS